MNVIALDISKDTADCHLSGNGKEDTLKIDNSISGSLQLLGWIKQHKIRKCVISMEATGIYYETLANHLSQYHQVYVINPLKIKNYSKAFFNRTKTDKADARLIAEYTKRHLDKLDGYHAPEADQYRLHKLIAAKEQIMLQSRQAKNRLHAAGSDELLKPFTKPSFGNSQNTKNISKPKLKHWLPPMNDWPNNAAIWRRLQVSAKKAPSLY